MPLTMNVKINFAFASFLTDMSSIVASLTHVQRVRILFKTCLRLHRGLPTQMQIIGDAYVRDEFKRHKAIDNPAQIASFMEAWAVSIFKRKKKSSNSRVFLQKYALTISQQIDAKQSAYGGTIGADFKPEDLDLFTGEQLAQLFELYEETSKPQDEYPSQ